MRKVTATAAPGGYGAESAAPLCQIRYLADRVAVLLTDCAEEPAASSEAQDLLAALARAVTSLHGQDPARTRGAPAYNALADLGKGASGPARSSAANPAALRELADWAHAALTTLPRPPRRC